MFKRPILQYLPHICSSSYDQFKSHGSIPDMPKQERNRRRSPPTDSEDEDPFHFDSLLSSPPAKKDDNSRKAISSLYRHASIVPVDPSATPAPHRFSLLREHASEGTIFVQEICDAEGRRWSLRVPASGLPDDMVSMLEELEKLALELGQALPRIVVTCSAESLSSKRAATLIDPVAESAELLHPPPANVVAIDGEYSLAKEKCRLVEREPEPICEPEPVKSTTPSSPVTLSSPSEQSLTCIYLPEVSLRPCIPSPSDTHQKLAPEFLSGSSTSPVLQPADGFHSKPPATDTTTSVRTSRQRAFFAALRDREPVARPARSGIARRLATACQPTESKAKPEANDAHATAPKSRVPMKSALPVLKTRSAAAPVLGARTTPSSSESDSRAPPLPLYGGLVTSPGAQVPNIVAATAATRKPSYLTNTQRQANSDKGGGGVEDWRSIPIPAIPASAPVPPSSSRKLKHFFRRPPTRSASDPPSYASVRRVAEGAAGMGAKRPASEVVQAVPREVVERSRMPRLPSARDLIRKLT